MSMDSSLDSEGSCEYQRAGSPPRSSLIDKESVINWLSSCSNIPIPIALHTCSAYPIKTVSQREVDLVAHAVDKRKAEFCAGRYCAHEALKNIGASTEFIPIGDKGDPIWPSGTVGSISHDDDVAISIVTKRKNASGIGIDIISTSHTLQNIDASIICSDDELNQLARITEQPLRENPTANEPINLVLLAFSLKEAAVKAISPTLDYYLDLRDINLSISNTSSPVVTANFINEPITLRIHWCVLAGFIITFTATECE